MDAEGFDALSVWLEESRHLTLSNQIFRLGEVTGWKCWPNGEFGPSNFERGLLLHRLVEQVAAKDVLEVGTGRGFSSICMGMASDTHQLNTQITTIDPIGPGETQEWPIRVDSEDTIKFSSREKIWENYVPKKFTKNIHQITSTSFVQLTKLLRSNREFDIIFLDAGHDAFSAAHDVAYAILLLRQGGILVLDDFSPTEWYGLGAIMVFPHIRRFFSNVRVLRTDGVIYPSTGSGRQESGMLVATGLGDHDFKVMPLRLIWWRLVWLAMRFTYTRTWLFPLSKKP